MSVYMPDARFPDRTYYDYFDFEGKRYPLGTTITLKEPYNSKLSDMHDKQTIILEHYVTHGKECYKIFWKYTFQGEIYCHQIYATSDKFIKEIIASDKAIIHLVLKPVEYEKDSENGEVKFGWLIYVLVMFGLLLFKDWWMGWIAASIYFFNWRKKKLRK